LLQLLLKTRLKRCHLLLLTQCPDLDESRK